MIQYFLIQSPIDQPLRAMTYPIIKVPEGVSSQLEQLGTKSKFWYRDQNNHRILFKQGRPGTGENWAEKVCCEICRLLGLPHAEYDFATANAGDWKGVVSPTFVPKGSRLILGNELLASFEPEYEKTKRYRIRQHTLGRVHAVLSRAPIGLPLGYQAPQSGEMENAFHVFIGYLLLDALVSNQDRHHENWGLVYTPDTGLFLAPTFDHASSLGRNETDEKRQERLKTRDSGHSVSAYVGRASSTLYPGTNSQNPYTTIDAFEKAAKYGYPAARYWGGKLSLCSGKDFEEIFDNIPESEITEPAKLFALKILEVNAERLCDLEILK